MNLDVRLAAPSERDLINAFYACEGRTTRVKEGERWIVATRDDFVVGVIRLCEEEGHQVMRTVHVAESERGQGVGKRMLDVAEPHMASQACHCLPYAYLTEFYGRIGFREIPSAEAPPHLHERLAGYNAAERGMIVMRRDAGPGRVVDDRPGSGHR